MWASWSITYPTSPNLACAPTLHFAEFTLSPSSFHLSPQPSFETGSNCSDEKTRLKEIKACGITRKRARPQPYPEPTFPDALPPSSSASSSFSRLHGACSSYPRSCTVRPAWGDGTASTQAGSLGSGPGLVPQPTSTETFLGSVSLSTN